MVVGSWRNDGSRPLPPSRSRGARTRRSRLPERQVGGACLLHNNSVLLVKQRAASKWGLPKGTREPGESLLSCMRREVREETGLDVPSLSCSYLGRFQHAGYTIYFFVLPHGSPCEAQGWDEREIETVEWIPIKNLGDYPLNMITHCVAPCLSLPLTSLKTYLNLRCNKSPHNHLPPLLPVIWLQHQDADP